MKSKNATPLTDALMGTRHPRIDFRNDEGKKASEFLTPVLQPHISDGSSVLDLGCGGGGTTFRAEMCGGQAVGIDCAESAIAFAREVAEAMGSSARFDVGDFTEMPYPDASFEVAQFPNNICECSYEKVAAIIRETHRVLKPQGIFVVTMRDNARILCAQDSRDGFPWELGSGKQAGTINIPEVGSFPYPTYFWTCGFAIHVIGEYFDLISLNELEKDRQALIFENHT